VIHITRGQAAHLLTIAEKDGYDPETAERLLRDFAEQLERPMLQAGLDLTPETPEAARFSALMAGLEAITSEVIRNTFGDVTGRFVCVILGRPGA
jgi:hypothetical protein